MFSEINQAPGAKSFLQRVAALSKTQPVSLDAVLAPSLEEEAHLRRLFAQDRQNRRLSDPYVNLVSVYDAPDSTGIRTTFARDVKNEEDLTAKHVFALSDNRRRKNGEPCVAESIDQFRKNWAIFTEGALSQLTDWSNVIAAGGSVLACLLPLSKEHRTSRRTIRKFYHSTGYPTSDIDLFIWGLNAEQAEVKINQIYEAVRDSVPWDVTCVRTKHAISIHSQYPYRSVQIVLRLYHSPAEILAGFDVDTSCVAYDGTRVLANPRSIVAMMRQANTVDITRRSPSYEVRLAKYAARGFEVYVPELRRGDVDPTIFERSLPRIIGLARLLVLEKLSKPESRVSYLESRRNLRSSNTRRTNIYTRSMRRRFKGDLKADDEIAGLDMNDYDVSILHIPYGPGWNAKRIEKLVYSTDLGMNSTFNPKNKNRRLHRHVAFFGTMTECIEDLCEYCPEPRNDEEKALREKEDENYIRGRISFIADDPGRQSMTGSFKPIDVGEWSEQAYLGPTEKLFNAIASKNRAVVLELLAAGDIDANRRDHVGRTALHVAILSSAPEICDDLIAAGARITARLSDGRTALHLAAYFNPPRVAQALLARSAYNAEKAKEAEEEAKAKAKAEKGAAMDEDVDAESERPSSEDDWSSEDDGEDGKKKTGKDKQDDSQAEAPGDADIPDDNPELPDILEIDALDWELKFTPLAYAILGGHLDVVEALLNSGADPKAVMKQNDYGSHIMRPLNFALLNTDDGRAAALVERLVRGGASSAQADNNLFSVFHSFVCSGRLPLIQKILDVDRGADSAINIPALDTQRKLTYPIVSAIERGSSALVALLLSHGAKANLLPDGIQKARNMLPQDRYERYGMRNQGSDELDYLKSVVLPAEASLVKQTYLLQLLLKLDVQISVPISVYYDNGEYVDESRQSVIEAVEHQISELKKSLAKPGTGGQLASLLDGDVPEGMPKTFAEFRKYTYVKLAKYRKREQLEKGKKTGNRPNEDPGLDLKRRRALAYFEDMLALLKVAGAKPFAEVCPNAKEISRGMFGGRTVEPGTAPESRLQYSLLSKYNPYSQQDVLPHQLDQYDALFDACWTGDDARIEELCLPRKGKKSEKEPIQITVTTKGFRKPSGEGDVFWPDVVHSQGDGVYNPFSVAIIARRWKTARLILAIATAQYKAPEEQTQRSSSIDRVINLYDDASESSDSEVEESEDDMDIDDNPKKPASLVDLASRESAIQVEVPPGRLITESTSSHFGQDGKPIFYMNIMLQACVAGDLESFVNICDMGKNLPEPQEPDQLCLTRALQTDHADILDEIIRRTGMGIDLQQLGKADDEKQDSGSKPESKLYLGLTVHGKKRKDLAKYHNNASSDPQAHKPLLWSAIQSSANKVIEYLSGPAVLAAYHYYASTASTDRAESLRKTKDLDERLPGLLGIAANERRETALTAAIIGPLKENRLAMIKKVVSLIPSQAKNFLHSSLALSGWNPLHLAVIEDLDEPVFEYLLSSGLSPESRDRYGMNILHHACSLNHPKVLTYFIKKLAPDVIARLILQKTYNDEETPLMCATRNRSLSAVKILLHSGIEAVGASLTMRDASGAMPLHAAVSACFPKICQALITASNKDILHIENGVGETPLETATIKWLIGSSTDEYTGRIIHNWGTRLPVFSGRRKGIMVDPNAPDAEALAKEIDSLQVMKTDLTERGKLATNKKLNDAIDNYLVYLNEKKFTVVATPGNIEKPKDEDRETDTFNRKENVILAAVQNSPGTRRLVHLADVQRSVLNSLSSSERKLKQNKIRELANEYRYNRRRLRKAKELPDEAEEEAVEGELQWDGILGWSQNCRTLHRQSLP